MVRACLPADVARSKLPAAVAWNWVVILGVAVTLATVLLARGARSASEPSLERRYRWLIRLTLGYAALLVLGVLVPLVRFALASARAASVDERTALLSVSIAAAFNLILGFVAFGTAPTLVAFMVARRMKAPG